MNSSQSDSDSGSNREMLIENQSLSKKAIGNHNTRSGPVTQCLKRKTATNDKLNMNHKKQRLTSKNAPSVDYTLPGGTGWGEEPQSSVKGQEMIRTSRLEDKKTYTGSGLKRSLHGIVYQLQHLMLMLYRVRRMGYPFRLATEIDMAEKFDDLVLHYRDNTGKKVHRFMQVKHKHGENKLINVSDLLAEEDGDFSLKKYFISWRRIKRHMDFSNSSSENFILCTNAGIDLKGLKDAGINVSKVKESDEFLMVTDRMEQPPRYQLQVDEPSKMYDMLRSTCDVNRLAKMVAQRVQNLNEIDLKNDIFKRYHVALGQEVIDIDQKKLSDNFIRDYNLSEKAQNFRESFFFYTKQLASKKDISEEEIQKRLQQSSLKLSKTFGKKNKPTTGSSHIAELPDDHINDREISDFLAQFILAVDQPNEIELGEMIKQEIGTDSQFNLLNTDILGDYFQSAFLDWFKKIPGQFLVNEDADDFFHNTEAKLNSIITVGLSSQYPAELRKNESWKFDLSENCDAHGRTLYHVAAEEGNIGIVRFFINRLNKNRPDQKAHNAIRSQDQQDLQAEAASEHRNESDLPIPLHTEGNSSNMDMNLQDKHKRTPLDIAMHGPCNLEVVKCFVEGGANIHLLLNDGSTPLHISANKITKLEVTKYLIEQGAEINSRDTSGKIPLHSAAYGTNNLDTVKYLVENGSQINTKDGRGISPLYQAAGKSGNLDIVKYLIEKGAIINSPTESLRNLLYVAVSRVGNLETVKYLIDQGENEIKYQDEDGYTLLHPAAAEAGNLDIVKYLIENGADFNAQTLNGITPLHEAAVRPDNFDVVKCLVNGGADINSENENGETILHIAARVTSNFDRVKYTIQKLANFNFGDAMCSIWNNHFTPCQDQNNFDVVKYLVSKGADVNCKRGDGYTPLHYVAFKASNLNVVKCLIENGANVNSQGKDDYTPLHYAAFETGNLDVIKYLIEKGADTNCQGKDGYTPLHYAASRCDNLEVIKYLIKKGSSINIRTKMGSTPLQNAVGISGNLDTVKYSFENGADVNCRNEGGYTPLYYATFPADNLDIIKYLIEKGSRVNTKNIMSSTPLHNAAGLDDNLEVIKYLVEQGADVNYQNNGKKPYTRNLWLKDLPCGRGYSEPQDYLMRRGSYVNFLTTTGSTPLHIAAGKSNNLGVVKYFIEKGADINCQNKFGYTPLYYAAFPTGNLDVVKYLLDKGANINCETKNSDTLLHFAASNGRNLEIVQYLIEKGLDINAKTAMSLTPLHKAAGRASGRLDVIKCLVERGADVNAVTEMGSIPLHFAARLFFDESLDVVKYLIDKGADINRRNKSHLTPILVAWNCSNIELMKYLIVEKGAIILPDDNENVANLFPHSRLY